MAYVGQPWPASVLAGSSVIVLVKEFMKRRKSDGAD